MLKYFFYVLFALSLSFTQVLAVEGVNEAEINLGMVAALEGPAMELGIGMKMGAEAYFKSVNERGGINGRKIRLTALDDSYEPNKTVKNTLKLLDEDKVFALTCFVGTPTGKVVIPIVTEKNIPLIGLFTGAEIFRKPLNKYIINIRGSYDDEADMLVEKLTENLSSSKIAVFYQDDAFGLAVLKGVKAALKRRGMSIAGEGTFSRNTLAIKTGLASIMRSNPDAVIMVGPYQPIAGFVKEGRAAGLNVPYATVSFVGTGPYLKELGKEAEKVIISQVVPFPYEDENSLPVVKEYQADLKKYFPDAKPGYVSLEGYITAKLLVLGLEKAGHDLTRDRLIDAIEGIRNTDMGGFKLDFSIDEHQGSYKIFMTQVVDGKLREVSSVIK